MRWPRIRRWMFLKWVFVAGFVVSSCFYRAFVRELYPGVGVLFWVAYGFAFAAGVASRNAEMNKRNENLPFLLGQQPQAEDLPSPSLSSGCSGCHGREHHKEGPPS